jgi:hypothetical protein
MRIGEIHEKVLVCILRSNVEITKHFAKTFVMVYCTILAEVGKAFAENFSFLQKPKLSYLLYAICTFRSNFQDINTCTSILDISKLRISGLFM